MTDTVPDTQMMVHYRCGSCRKFSQCYAESSQLLLNLGLPTLESAEDDCRSCPAGDAYEATL